MIFADSTIQLCKDTMSKIKGKQLLAAGLVFALAGGLYGCSSDGETASSYDNRGEVSPQSGSRQENAVSTASSGPSQRSKRTEIKGDGDQFTIMVYMCGTDLESNYGAATADILEMCEANLNDSVNILLYTGGTSQWQNNLISPDTNQIWQVMHEDIVCVEEDMGALPMTDPDTLSGFVSYCSEHYPANRNVLILWDHGGGALYGYGCDEIFGGDSMQINEIDSALETAGVTFDFIGFDACLMATVETACMAERHADYMIGSEEVEPGSGWFYTNWLNLICDNPSVPTQEIGKMIADDFIQVCWEENTNDASTLSVIDLTEMYGVYNALCSFSANAKDQLDKNNFKHVSHSVNNTKAFGDDIYDTIDLMHFAQNCDIEGSRELINAVSNAVVYSATSRNVSNANGMTIYVPYNDIYSFENMLTVYKDIGLEGAYTDFIKAFANIVVGGQEYIGSNTPVDALNDESGADDQPDFSGWVDFNWFDEDYVSEYTESYEENAYDSEELIVEDRGGYFALALSDEDWEIISDIQMQLFYDDGEGYIDLGTDNYFEVDEDGALMVDYDGLWFTLGDTIVPLYVSTEEDFVEGYIPCERNGEYVNLVVRWNEEGTGIIEGAIRFYENGMSMKGLIPLEDGDVIQLLCDYYTYDGAYDDAYSFGEPFEYDSSLGIEYTPSGNGEYLLYYCLTDIYNNTYYVEPVSLIFGK